MSTRQTLYDQLVADFKNYSFGEGSGITNPFAIQLLPNLPEDHLNPWAHWQGKLNAKIVLIGQDWGDEKFFRDHGGKDPDEKNPTNERLRLLFNELGYEIGTPGQPGPAPVYFTNAVLGIKTGGMAAPVKTSWYTSTAGLFLEPLIENIIRPGIVIAMSSKAHDAVRRIYRLPKIPFTAAIEYGGFELYTGRKLFVVAHCSGLGMVNRPFVVQQQDWK